MSIRARGKKNCVGRALNEKVTMRMAYSKPFLLYFARSASFGCVVGEVKET